MRRGDASTAARRDPVIGDGKPDDGISDIPARRGGWLAGVA
jgi:hypothetical protein